MSTTTAPNRKRRRRLLALASIGLALLVGVSVTTLAAWQDHEYVWGGDNSGNPLGTTYFSVELSIDGGAHWTTATTSPGTALSFGTTGSGSSGGSLLTPGDTVYASVLLRAAAGSRGGSVSLSNTSFSAPNLLTSVLTFGAKTGLVSSQCNNAGFSNVSLGNTLVAVNSLLSNPTTSSTFTLPQGTGGAAGDPVGVCFAVSLPSAVTNTVGNLNTSPIWHFDATSN